LLKILETKLNLLHDILRIIDVDLANSMSNTLCLHCVNNNKQLVNEIEFISTQG
jgi:hypothetical protein